MISQKTLTEIHKIIEKYVPDCSIKKMLDELRFVKGNKSFKQTMEALYNYELDSEAHKDPVDKDIKELREDEL